MEGVSQFDYEGMIEQRKNFLLGLYISVETGSEYPLFPDGFECEKSIFAFLFDEVDLAKSTLPYSFVEFEARKSNSFHFVLIFDELVHLEDVLLS